MSDNPCCQICLEEVDWDICFECKGIGGEDLDTLDEELCDTCKGYGGWWQCPNHHYHDGVPLVQRRVQL